MSATLTIDEKRRQAHRRFNHERRMNSERRKATEGVESTELGTTKFNLTLDLLGSVIAAGISIIVLISTGLYSGASSTVAEIILIVAIVSASVVAFRRAFYS